jgi:acetolactate synthase-1/2/3 large subunit
VVLSLPLDVQSGSAPDTVSAVKLQELSRLRPDAAAVEQLVRLIQEAERPVFVAGRGGRGAKDSILGLAEHAGALVATSAVANGLFNGETFNLGISGGFSSPATAELISGADLIVGWGCTLNMWTMRHGRLISPGTNVVQVDVEDASLGANRPISLGVLGDSSLTADDALAVLKTVQPAPAEKYRTESNAVTIKQASRWRDVDTPDLSTATSIDPRVISRELDSILPTERIVAVDSGNFMGYPSQYLAVPDEFGFCFTQAFQAIGLGLYTAIGAAIAQPERLPVLGAGDGGFLMGISELETAVRLELPLVCIVYNDAAYGAEVHHFAEIDDSLDLGSVKFPDTDIAAIARGFGAEGVTVRTLEDLGPVKDWIAAYRAGAQNRPLVIDAKISSDGGSWWLAEAFQGH